jgi:hypothetical protein
MIRKTIEHLLFLGLFSILNEQKQAKKLGRGIYHYFKKLSIPVILMIKLAENTKKASGRSYILCSI